MLLDEIKGPNDIKKIEKEDYGILAEEIREFLIDRISECGGHLASNLGVVELTMALHLSLDLPDDKIVWMWGIRHIPIRSLPEEKMNLTNSVSMAESVDFQNVGKVTATLSGRDTVPHPFPQHWESPVDLR